MNKYSVLILVVLVSLLAPLASADAFSAWSDAGGCWTATNDTYTLVMWNATGGKSYTVPSGVSSIEYLIVAGGGGGGYQYGGGGGAGGLLTATGFAVTPASTVTVTVGGGGAGATSPGDGSDGGNSVFSTITATGGGGGAGINNNGRAGGSGGGGGGKVGTTTGGAKTASPVQGNDGAGNNNQQAPGYPGGGGGGAGAAGSVPASGSAAGNGGAGVSSSITGASVGYAGGGGAGIATTYTAGTGSHGGGNGAATADGTAGSKNTGGGGGGGAGSGTYLAGKDGGSGIVIIKYLTPTGVPTASFTPVGTINGTDLASVTFTDTSTGTISDYNWSYQGILAGNNTLTVFATTRNVTASFGPGNFTIKHGVNGTFGSNISTQITWVNVSATVPVAAFSGTPLSGLVPLSVQFTDSSSGSPTSWLWDFGDGNTTGNTDQNPVHLYTAGGTYNVNLTATNAYGSDYEYKASYITVYNVATADFATFNTAGTAPFTTYLYDTSTNLTPGPVTYYWMFGDGNTSTASALYYNWNITGTYSVNHSVSNGLSTSWDNRSAYITVGTPTPPTVAPVASFYGGPQIGAPPLKVFFTDVSNNTPTSWNWSFGDGTFSTTQSPNHWYNSSGFFTVNLTATNSAGSNSTSQTNFIMVY